MKKLTPRERYNLLKFKRIEAQREVIKKLNALYDSRNYFFIHYGGM